MYHTISSLTPVNSILPPEAFFISLTLIIDPVENHSGFVTKSKENLNLVFKMITNLTAMSLIKMHARINSILFRTFNIDNSCYNFTISISSIR